MNKFRVLTVISSFSLVTVFGILTQKADAARFVVGHDINTLGSFNANDQEEVFAVNLANFLTSGSSSKNLLLYESNPDDGNRDFSTGVVDALTEAGFSVTVTPDYSTSFSGFDAVFVAQDYPVAGFLDNPDLINFVDAGGGVYLTGGVANAGSAPSEAAGWDVFLNNYGLAFDPSRYNGINNVAITSTHPIFDGVTSLRSANGQSILDLGTNPNTSIVQFAGDQGVYAVFDSSIVGDPPPTVPEPSISILGLLAFAGMTMKMK